MLAANRANARLSTGPRSKEGKNRVRFNGLRHGLSARSFRDAINAMGFDPAQFDRIVSSYPPPQSADELRGIEQMAYTDWCLRWHFADFFRPCSTKAGMSIRINKRKKLRQRKAMMLLKTQMLS
jgi:hypothetical protein